MFVVTLNCLNDANVSCNAHGIDNANDNDYGDDDDVDDDDDMVDRRTMQCVNQHSNRILR